MPLLELPVTLQKDAYSCGAAVFMCVTAYWEGRGRRIKSDPLHGTPPDLLEPSFRAAGYRVLSGEMDVPTLKALTAHGWPVAALVKTADGVGHWVAVRGVCRNRVYVMDPLDGERVVRAGEWEANWCDYDRRGTVFRRYGLAVWC